MVEKMLALLKKEECSTPTVTIIMNVLYGLLCTNPRVSDVLWFALFTAATLEKDVQLLGVATEDAVHIFEYTEEEEQSLIHVKMIHTADVKVMIVVEYYLVMVQDKEGADELTIACSDLDEDSVKATYAVKKPAPDSIFKIQPGGGVTPCLYFSLGTLHLIEPK